MADVDARFWTKVAVGDPGDCWEWTAATTIYGYGWFRLDGKSVQAPRVAYFLTHGEWPIVCRHTCDNRLCVNPAHLLDGTQQDNVRDMVERGRLGSANREKQSCVHGHPFSEENTRFDANGWRKCRECDKQSARRRRRRVSR